MSNFSTSTFYLTIKDEFMVNCDAKNPKKS